MRTLYFNVLGNKAICKQDIYNIICENDINSISNELSNHDNIQKVGTIIQVSKELWNVKVKEMG